jgi:hypothetical protein
MGGAPLALILSPAFCPMHRGASSAMGSRATCRADTGCSAVAAFRNLPFHAGGMGGTCGLSSLPRIVGTGGFA